MTIRMKIDDGEGTGRAAAVTENNALRVQAVPETSVGVPPDDLANLRLYRDFLKNGSSPNANVNGSVTPVEFSISSQLGKNIWITSVKFIFEDVSLEMNTQDFRRFGTATGGNTPLTNGLLFRTVQGGETIEIFAEPIVYMGDFFTYADSYLNLLNSVASQTDFLTFNFEFEKPVVLPQGGNDSIRLVVRDNLTSIDKFQVIVRGYQEFT